MKNIIQNKEEGRLRSGWRILGFLILFWAFANLVFLAKSFFPDITKKEFIEGYSLLIVSILAIAATASVLISRKLLDKKSFRSLGLKLNKNALKDIAFGFLLSALMAGTFFLVLIGFDLIEFEGINFNETVTGEGFVNLMSVFSLASMLLLLLETVLVGYWEELVFRGYLLQNMVHGLGLKLAVVISCILYGLIHASNPNATILSSVIIVAFGFLRIYGYLTTQMLWLSIGMHIGWNFFQGPIFGFAASGHASATLIQHSFTSEKSYLTGGEFGPEGSIIILPILLITLFVMRWYAIKISK